MAIVNAAFDRLVAELKRPPFHSWLRPNAKSVDEERKEVEVTVAYRPELKSRHAARRVFHGGIVATLVDISGYAVAAIWHEGPTPTVALHVEFLRPAVGDELLARGVLRWMGRSVARVDVEVSAAGKLVALGRATYSTAGMRQ